jgi:hypothetical protein
MRQFCLPYSVDPQLIRPIPFLRPLVEEIPSFNVHSGAFDSMEVEILKSVSCVFYINFVKVVSASLKYFMSGW